MTDDRHWLLCAHCGDRIGSYEPLWLELADGTLKLSAFLRLGHDLPPGENGWRIWHRGCRRPDGDATRR
jgi:hypothetical protein